MTSVTPIIFSNLYVVYCGWNVHRIRDFLEHEVSNPHVGPIRIDYKNGRETNRTIVVMAEENYQELKAKGYSNYSKTADFRIMPYVVKDIGLVAPGADKRYSYYIRFPVTATDPESIRQDVVNKLDSLADFGFFARDSYVVRTPLLSREQNVPRNFCLVTFSDSTSKNSIIAGRIVLHQSHWRDHSELMKCFWTINFAPRRGTYVRPESEEEEATTTVNSFSALSDAEA